MTVSRSLTVLWGVLATLILGFGVLGFGILGSGAALAAQPAAWALGFQDAASPTAEKIHDLNTILLVIIIAVVAFVMGLLLYVAWRFSEKRNPTPSKTTHNTLLEVAWTALPVIILVVIAVPSFKLLYFADRAENAEMTIKAIGRQWYWSYEYPDNGDFTFDAYMVATEDLEEGQPRLLTADTAVVLPIETDIRILVTASDVLHSFAMPAFGLKLDGVPGRINETWVRINKEGTYYGQCSELCGVNHSFMPIMIKAVSKADFEAWTEKAREEYAQLEGPQSPDAETPVAQTPVTETPVAETAEQQGAQDVQIANVAPVAAR